MFKVDEDEYLDHMTPAHVENLLKAYQLIIDRRAKRIAAATTTAPIASQQVAGDETSDDQESADDVAPSQ